MRPASTSPYLRMVLASLVFSAMGAMAHALGESWPWQYVALCRAGLVLVLVSVLTRAQGKTVFVIGPPTLWMRSIAGSLSMVCTFYAITRPGIPVSDMLTLTNTFPVWVALLSWPVLGETPPLQVWPALASGGVGVWLIQQPHFDQGSLAIVAALAASAFTAVAMIGLHRLKEFDPQAIVVHFSAVATAVCFASCFVFDRRPVEPEADPMRIGLLLAGIGVTASMGQILLTHAFAAGNPSKVAVVALVQIVFALGFDLVLFEYPLGIARLLGIVLIVAPTAWLMLMRE